jgi:hypothetical protein
LERGGFIVDDTIFIKCMIDTSTIHPPWAICSIIITPYTNSVWCSQ